MINKLIIAWSILVICLTMQAQAQYDPLAMPVDMRRTESSDAEKVIIDPYADPLGIDALMRQIDPHHTSEYLDKISGREYMGPFIPISQELQGYWTLDLFGSMPGRMDLMLVQNRDAVFGRGSISLAGGISSLSASGWTAKDLLYLDLVDVEAMMLYRCSLTMSKDFLSGSYNAYDAQGRNWSGTLQGGRRAMDQ